MKRFFYRKLFVSTRVIGLAVITQLSLATLSAQTTFTQRLQQQAVGEGRVTVTQSAQIDTLVNGPQVAEPARTVRQQTTTENGTSSRQEPANTKQEATTTPDKQATTQQHQTTPHASDSTTVSPTEEEGQKKVMKNGYKIPGFRVQVFAGGNSRQARIKAERTGREINALFPGEPVYVHFYSPRWICRMGNYRTLAEAREILRQVRKLGYKSAIVVKGKITVQTP